VTARRTRARTAPTAPTLDALARPSGTFAILALDQRESLRAIIAERTGRRLDAVANEELRSFKVMVARTLTPVASAVLLDVDFGLEPVLAARALAPGCGLIVAADALQQAPGQPVADTALDERVDPLVAAASGASGLKLLVLWRGPSEADHVVDLAKRFVARCRRNALLSVLEPVVRPPRYEAPGKWDREAAILEAAAALGSIGADLYKTEVPLHGHGEADEIARRCSDNGSRVSGPWVVLSQGVEVGDFPAAVEAACRGGASGFLAGRAVWTDSIGPGGREELASRLEAIARPRLAALAETVDRLGRPWSGAATASRAV
jgi:sulfofructosephosphate aldolase